MTVTDNKLPRWVRYAGCHYYNPGHPVCDGWISLWKISKDGHGCRAPIGNVYPADPRQAQALDEAFDLCKTETAQPVECPSLGTSD